MACRLINNPLSIIRLREWMRIAGVQFFVVRRMPPDDRKYGGRWYLEVEARKERGDAMSVTAALSNLKKCGVYDGWSKTQFGTGYASDVVWVKFGIRVSRDMEAYLIGEHKLVEDVEDD